RRRNAGRRGVDEGAVHPRAAVAAAQLAVDADGVAGLRGEAREVGPGQLELGGVAPGGDLPGDLRPAELEVFEDGQIPDAGARLDLRAGERRPEHVQTARAELRGPELVAAARVEVELDGVAVIDRGVRGDVGRLLVE